MIKNLTINPTASGAQAQLRYLNHRLARYVKGTYMEYILAMIACREIKS